MTGKETIHALEDHYGKLLAFVMAKYNLPHVVFTMDDLIKAGFTSSF